MNYLIIGDVYGCFFTLKKFLKNHWNPREEILIFLGDYVNKGKNTFKVLKFIRLLQMREPDKVILLKGNNEWLFVKKYRDMKNKKAKEIFKKHKLKMKSTLTWLEELPHLWENPQIFCSHAGISLNSSYPPVENNLDLMFNRDSLQNIGKVQFLGHIVHKKPSFDESANAWYLDTGAGYGKKLTGVSVSPEGEILEFVKTKVDERDIL